MNFKRLVRAPDWMHLPGRGWAWLRRKRSRGQSLVEFTVLLPLLLIMLSGLIEFGFLLNDYLDLIDATREVARFAANDDPLHDETGSFNPDPTHTPEPAGFYDRVWSNTDRALSMGGQLALDPAEDEVIVSVFTVAGSTVTERYPTLQAGNGGENGWRRWGNDTSNYTTSEVQTIVTDSAASTGTTPPNTGFVLVEIYYDYHMLLGLPWITAFVPDPVTLHAYAIMPNTAAEPTPTP